MNYIDLYDKYRRLKGEIIKINDRSTMENESYEERAILGEINDRFLHAEQLMDKLTTMQFEQITKDD